MKPVFTLSLTREVCNPKGIVSPGFMLAVWPNDTSLPTVILDPSDPLNSEMAASNDFEEVIYAQGADYLAYKPKVAVADHYELAKRIAKVFGVSHMQAVQTINMDEGHPFASGENEMSIIADPSYP